MKNADTVRGAVDADLRFHFTIAEATNNTVLLRIMNTVADLMHTTSRHNRENLYAKSKGRILSEHEAILTAIRNKN